MVTYLTLKYSTGKLSDSASYQTLTRDNPGRESLQYLQNMVCYTAGALCGFPVRPQRWCVSPKLSYISLSDGHQMV
jgi:hypothetical protein